MRKRKIFKCRYCGSESRVRVCRGCYNKLKLMKGWRWEYKPEKKRSNMENAIQIKE